MLLNKYYHLNKTKPNPQNLKRQKQTNKNKQTKFPRTRQLGGLARFDIIANQKLGDTNDTKQQNIVTPMHKLEVLTER